MKNIINTENLNKLAIAMLLALVGIGFYVASMTVESNSLKIGVASLEAQHRGKLIREVQLLTLELEMVKSDVEKIRETLKSKSNEKVD